MLSPLHPLWLESCSESSQPGLKTWCLASGLQPQLRGCPSSSRNVPGPPSRNLTFQTEPQKKLRKREIKIFH